MCVSMLNMYDIYVYLYAFLSFGWVCLRLKYLSIDDYYAWCTPNHDAWRAVAKRQNAYKQSTNN